MAPSTRSRSVAAGKQPLVEETPANPSPSIQPILDYRPQEGGRESPTPHNDTAEPSDDDKEEGYYEPAQPTAGPSNTGATPFESAPPIAGPSNLGTATPSAKPSMTQILAVMTQLLAAQARPASVPEGPAFRTPSMRAPDNFDGTNPSKLRGYIQSCNLIFHNDLRSFPNDRRKVIYAAGYLSGKCSKWIEPYLSQLGNEDPNFLLNNWEIYESQLFSLYGDRNETRNAELELDELTMKENGYASTYITEFRALMGRIEGWGECALMFKFRKGLPPRLLDAMSTHFDNVNSLLELINLTLKFDTRYHKQQKEKRREPSVPHSKPAEPRTERGKFVPNPRTRSFAPWKKTSPTADTTTTRAESPLNALGKLKEGEKARREKAGLCVYCGGKHALEDCDKRKRVTKDVPSSSTPSSGKA